MDEQSKILQQAKKAYRNGDYQGSFRLNRSALMIARKQFSVHFATDDPERALASVLVCFLNMIDACIAEKEYLIGPDVFREMLAFLETVPVHDGLREDQQNAVLNSVRHVARESVSYLKQTGSDLPSEDKQYLLSISQQLQALTFRRAALH